MEDKSINQSRWSGFFSGGVRLTELILTLLLLGSLATNFLLSRKVTQLQGAIHALKSEGKLLPGTVVPDIEGFDADGNLLKIEYGGNALPTVLYVFSSQCGWCRRNEAGFETLVKALRDDYRIVGLSTTSEGAKEYIQSKGYGFPTIAQPTPGIIDKYKLGGTPQTFLISPRAQVVRTWVGAYTGDVKADLEKQFGIRLPTLKAPTAE